MEDSGAGTGAETSPLSPLHSADHQENIVSPEKDEERKATDDAIDGNGAGESGPMLAIANGNANEKNIALNDVVIDENTLLRDDDIGSGIELIAPDIENELLGEDDEEDVLEEEMIEQVEQEGEADSTLDLGKCEEVGFSDSKNKEDQGCGVPMDQDHDAIGLSSDSEVDGTYEDHGHGSFGSADQILGWVSPGNENAINLSVSESASAFNASHADSLIFNSFSVENEACDQLSKTLQEIFQYLINNRATTLDEVWQNYIASSIEPTGWIGMAKCSELSKQVRVIDVSVNDLQALVINLEDEEKESLTSYDRPKYWVPLERLFVSHPELEGDNSVDLEGTKELLKLYRAFKFMLHMPWDTEFAYEWYQTIFFTRIQLLSDMVSGNVHPDQCRRILQLIQTARDVAGQIQSLEEEDDDSDLEIDEVENGVTQSVAEEKYCNLNMKMADLQNEFEKFEKKDIRQYMQYISVMTSSSKFSSKIAVVVPEGEMTLAMMEQWKKVLDGFPTESNFKILYNLPSALNGCQPGTYIYLFPGKYTATGLCGLDGGGSIIGLGESREDVRIVPDAAGDIWFCLNKDLTIENLTLELKPPNTADLLGFDLIGFSVKKCWGAPKAAIHVEAGHLRLKNVLFIGPDAPMNSSDDVMFSYGTLPIRAKCPEHVELELVEYRDFERVGVTPYQPTD